jgi:hypothetical protein
MEPREMVIAMVTGMLPYAGGPDTSLVTDEQGIARIPMERGMSGLFVSSLDPQVSVQVAYVADGEVVIEFCSLEMEPAATRKVPCTVQICRDMGDGTVGLYAHYYGPAA